MSLVVERSIELPSAGLFTNHLPYERWVEMTRELGKEACLKWDSISPWLAPDSTPAYTCEANPCFAGVIFNAFGKVKIYHLSPYSEKIKELEDSKPFTGIVGLPVVHRVDLVEYYVGKLGLTPIFPELDDLSRRPNPNFNVLVFPRNREIFYSYA